jgi:hypothetical protein
MTKTPIFLALVASLACSVDAVAQDEMRPQMELQRKLVGEGWKVRQVKTFNGCYEVYGFDARGERTEAFFHPRSFEPVGRVRQGD